MAASEMEPFVQTGPFAHALSALSRELQALDHEVSIVLPFYRSIMRDRKYSPQSTGVRFLVSIGNEKIPCEIFEIDTACGIQAFFIGRDEYFDRPEPSGHSGYQNHSARFTFYARCVVELARRISPTPDIIQCHNWQAALIPVMIQDAHLPFKTVLSISQLEHQGNFWSHDFALTNLPSRYFSPSGLEFYGSLNFLKGGILFADAIVLPSKHCVKEAQQVEHGCGLDGVLREHSKKLYGIHNGIDESIWNPEQDHLIRAFYSASNQKGKSMCSAELLSSSRLAPLPTGPVIAILSQLVTGAGFDLFLPALDRLLAEDVRVIILGQTGNYDTALKVAAHKHSSKLSYQVEYNELLIHQLFAGVNIFLLPRKIELHRDSIMKALKYGAIPIVRTCSGLYPFIQDYDHANHTGTGFLFYDNTSEALLDSLRRALNIFRDKDAWKGIVTRAMSKDFSWKSSANCYEKLYASLLSSS